MQTEIEAQLPAETIVEKLAHDIQTEQHIPLSLWALAGGLGLGWLGSVFFVERALGISFPIFIVLLVVMVMMAARRAGARLRPGNLWLTVPIVFFAAMVAVHADPAITSVNVLLTLALGTLWLHYLPLSETVADSSVAEYTSASVECGLATTVAPISALGNAREWVRGRHAERSRTLFSVIRGLLFALPVVFIFAILLSSADAAFSGALESIWQFIGLGNTDRLFSQAVVALLLGWFVCGSLVYVTLRNTRQASESADTLTQEMLGDAVDAQDGAVEASLISAKAKLRAKRRPVLMNMIEGCIVLGSVNLLFGLFVLIQFGYFFGGQANVTVNGLTYAAYARRGFFELVAVAVLTLGLILALDWVTVRSGRRQQWLFRGLALLMVALTGVMMLSASQRMSLYEAAYGYTHLRVYVHIFIRWLAVLFGFFVLTLFRVRPHIFSLGVLLCAMGYGASLNLMSVEGYIAQRNIDRYFEGYRLDGWYLSTFSVDATEPILALYQREDAPQAVRDFAGNWLLRQYLLLSSLRETSGDTFLSTHLGRDRAWTQLISQVKLPTGARDVPDCCSFVSPFAQTGAEQGESPDAGSRP